MKAVLVIDMQEDFFRKDELSRIRESLCSNINALTRKARQEGVPVIWIRQEFRADLSDAYAVMKKGNIRVTIAGTPGCEILPELERPDSDPEFIKKRYSAFFGTGLEAYLQETGITELTLAGINTHACVRTTAIDAYQRDLEVVIPRDCIASYDQKHHEITLKYLADRIAKLV